MSLEFCPSLVWILLRTNLKGSVVSLPETAFCRLTFEGRPLFSYPKFPSEGTKWWIIFFRRWRRRRRRRRMSDERANNWARRPRTSDIFKRKTRMMNRKLELHNNPSSHNNDQRYKNGIDLGRDKGRKKEGRRGKAGARCGISLLSSFRLFRAGCHNEKVKFMEFLLSSPLRLFFLPREAH